MLDNNKKLIIDTQIANKEFEITQGNITSNDPVEILTDKPKNLEVKSIIINNDTNKSNAINDQLSIKKQQQLDKLSDTSSSDDEIFNNVDTNTIKTVNIELIPKNSKTKPVRKSRNMGYAFYD